MGKRLSQVELREQLHHLQLLVRNRKERQERLRALNAPEPILDFHAKSLAKAQHRLARVERQFEQNFAAVAVPPRGFQL